MNIYIGENVKRLRIEKGLTQEELAGFLGVSFQAVSKWERGIAYPDVEMIPVIANYFDITIDELMGNSRIRCEAKINEYLQEYHRLDLLCTPEANREKNALAKTAYAEFPYDFRILNMYRHSLLCGRDAEDFGDTKPTIRFLCEKILSSCTDDYFRQCAVSSLLAISETREEEERCLAMLSDDFCILRREKREDICFERGRFDEALRCCQENLQEYFSWFIVKIDTLLYDGRIPKELQPSTTQQIAVNEKMIEILRLLFENGDFGQWNWYLGCKYEENARLFLGLGDTQNGLTAFEKSVDCWIDYYTLPEKFAYSSFLFNRLEFVRDTRSTADEVYKTPGRYLSRILSDNVYDCVRENERFCQSVKKLEECVK